MRFRLPELLKGQSPYSLSKASEGRISMSTAYRLVKLKGRVKTFDAELCEVLCEVLGVGPADLFEVEGPEPPARPKKATRSNRTE